MHILEQIVEKERTVCIIDDDKIQHFIHERCLQQHGLSRPMISFFDGADALSFLYQHAEDLSVLPDIIFLDLNMPKMTGIECLSIIKKKPRKANSRVFPKFSLEVLQTSFYGNL